MKTALYQGNKTFKIAQCPEGTVGPDDVKVKIAYCGICGTDLHIFHGKMDQRVNIPQSIGHETSGTVAEVGSNVKGFAPGDKVVVRPLQWCGKCATCAAGHNHICPNLKFMGIDTEGAFQEYWTVPADTLHKCPDDMSLKLAALIEPLAVACHDVRRARVAAGERVVVLGGGPIGLLVAMVARAAGAEILISEISEYRLELAEKLGFSTFNPMQGDLLERVNELTGGVGADVVFEVTASAAGAEVMTELVRPRGRILLVGIYSQPQPVTLFKFFWRELEMIGARVYEHEDYDRAIELAASGSLPLEAVISGVYELDDIQAAFESFEGNSTAMKVLIKT